VKLQGGNGYQLSKSSLKHDHVSDYITAQMNFQGPPDMWRDFCRQVVRLYTKIGKLESIYLQKLEFEFEASSDAIQTASTRAESSRSEDVPPPAYAKQ
jgi:hypothetical protein